MCVGRDSSRPMIPVYADDALKMTASTESKVGAEFYGQKDYDEKGLRLHFWAKLEKEQSIPQL